MTFEVREYQTRMIDQARELLRRRRKAILFQLPTGGGKTVLGATMLKTITDRGKRAFFIVHRRELIRQSADTFDMGGIPYGYCAAGMPLDRKQPVQLASIQTLGKRLDRMPTPDVIVFDEAHHLAAGTWAKVYSHYPDATMIGLSATPERLDGAGLSGWFADMVTGPSTADLIAQGYLSPYRLFAPGVPDTSSLHTRGGDFKAEEAAALMDKPSITGDAVDHYRRLAPGRRAVVFCVSIQHSQHVAAQFKAAGFRAAHLDGDTAFAERDHTIAEFRAGRIEVLCNVDLFGEGFDLPALEVSILLRPTQSLAMYLQQVGRSLRVAPGKTEALILDHAGNSARHGLPDDERAWTLEGRVKAKREGGDAGVAIKTCKACFATVRAFKTHCPHCGYEFPVVPREIEQRDGALVEVDPAQARIEKLREQGNAQTEADLIAVGARRGMKRPELWARHVLRARAEKRARSRA